MQEKDLKLLRGQIDSMDDQLLELIIRRSSIVDFCYDLFLQKSKSKDRISIFAKICKKTNFCLAKSAKINHNQL